MCKLIRVLNSKVESKIPLSSDNFVVVCSDNNNYANCCICSTITDDFQSVLRTLKNKNVTSHMK